MSLSYDTFVAPYVGAWIETVSAKQLVRLSPVAPYVGAWIETEADGIAANLKVGRTLRGCVD